MRLPLLFARRYLFSKKSLSVINIISRVSSLAVGIPVAAMVILLSVFNGFESITDNMFNHFDPDLMISPVEGKTLLVADIEEADMADVEGVEAFSMILEQSVLLGYGDRQYVATLRGVDSNYRYVVPLDDLIVRGESTLRFGEVEQAVVGQGVAAAMSINPALYTPLMVYTPRRGVVSSLLPLDVAKSERLFPAGIFMLNMDIDSKYVFSTIEFAQELLDYPAMASSVAVRVTPEADVQSVQRALQSRLGDSMVVETRYEQKASVFQIMKYEKWGIFFITLLVLIIASFSIVGSLVMLILDKRENIRTLVTLGADVKLVRAIFTTEGFLIGMIGSLGGLVLGVTFCLLQQHFGFIKIGAETFLVDAYPVVLRVGDVIGVVVATVAVNYVITKSTVTRMLPQSIIRV